jgi:hypothetical protein
MELNEWIEIQRVGKSYELDLQAIEILINVARMK